MKYTFINQANNLFDSCKRRSEKKNKLHYGTYTIYMRCRFICWCSSWIVFLTSALMKDLRLKPAWNGFYPLEKKGAKSKWAFLRFNPYIRLNAYSAWPETEQMALDFRYLLRQNDTKLHEYFVFMPFIGQHIYCHDYVRTKGRKGDEKKKQLGTERDYIKKGNSICNLLFDRFLFANDSFISMNFLSAMDTQSCAAI